MSNQKDFVDWKYLFKVVVFGVEEWDKWKGLIDHYFTQNYLSVLGYSLGSRKLELRGYRVMLQLWFFSSKEQFDSLHRAQVEGANGAIVLYNPRRGISSDKISGWCELLRERCGEIPILLISTPHAGEGSGESGARIPDMSMLEEEIGEKYNIYSFKGVRLEGSEEVERLWEEIARVMVERLEELEVQA